VVKRGRIFCELAGITEARAREIFKLAASKLPLAVRVVKKEVSSVAVKQEELHVA
jgi:ribosomal protein L16/L10AE